MWGMKHDEIYIYASVKKKNEARQYRVYGILYCTWWVTEGWGLKNQVEKRTRSRPFAVASLWPNLVNLVL
jgi:hypothetical protein